MNNSLCTARLQLEVPTSEDAIAILEIAGDPRTVEHNPSDLLQDLDQARDLVKRWIRHWRDHGCGYWCVRQAGRPEVVGYCGLKTTSIKGLSALNLIYRFTPEVWGRGYATESASAAIAWSNERQPNMPIVARVRSANVASRNVALKVDLRRDSGLDENGEDGSDLAFTNRHRMATGVE